MAVRFKRATAPFDAAARARLCSSSGSDRSAGSSQELGDLVDSFMEREVSGGAEVEAETEDARRSRSAVDDSWADSDVKETLERLLQVPEGDAVAETIREETEIVYRRVGAGKRRLMSELRERGFDAGLCKSRWEKSGQFPSGDYEYIDVAVAAGGGGQTRYLVEANLAGEFEIARPSARYLELLVLFPTIFVGKSESLKRVVRLMCAAAKESLKRSDLDLPPWRRNGYVQAKWFGSYKRTTNRTPSRTGSDSVSVMSVKKEVGFVRPVLEPATWGGCGRDLARKEGVRKGGGNLALAFNGMRL